MQKNLISSLIFFLLSIFLLLDAINGFLLLGLGIDSKISVIYKAIVLCLIVTYLANYKPGVLLAGLSFFFFLLIGETYSIFSLNTSATKIGFLIIHSIKVISPFLLFFFLLDRTHHDPMVFKKIEKVILVNGLIFLANIILGGLGYGFYTYGDGSVEWALGSKGFFYAGNEISALLVIFGGYFLSRTYMRSRLGYLPMVTLTLLVGLLISTKTSIMAVILLAVFLPLVYEGKRLFYLNNMPSIVFLSLLTLLLLQSIQIFEVFKETPLYSRMMFFFDKHGVLGLLFSGRELYLSEIIYHFNQSNPFVSVLFGNGISYYADHTKFSIEIDFLDMFYWHGFGGVLIIFIVFSALSFFALKNAGNKRYPMAMAVLLTNFMLFSIANLSGHVFTSGMLGLLWPCFAMMAKYDVYKVVQT